MIKRLLAILMASYFMLSTISVNAYANENRAAIELEIMELAKLYDVNVMLEENVAETSNHVSVTRDELITLFNNISTASENVYFAPETVISPGKPTRAEASHTFSQWVPFQYYSYLGAIFQLAVWRYVYFDYDYAYPVGSTPRFIGYRNVSSQLSGAAVEGWTQTGCSVNFSTTTNYNDTASVSVTGYSYIGIEYQGVNLSIQAPPETWNFTLRRDNFTLLQKSTTDNVFRYYHPILIHESGRQI